jgi:hypothetical protein
MLAAIDFDDQPRVQAGKVDNVVVDRYLPTEAKPIDLALAQEAPQGALRVRHIVAEAACVLVWHRRGGYPPSSFG